MRAPEIDAIVLAGGSGTRLGGVSKPDLRVAGHRMLDLVLDAVEPCRDVVVVAPDTVIVPPDCRRTLEEPPGGGPVAGIAAGIAALYGDLEASAPTPGLGRAVLVLACDMPGVSRGVAPLVAAFEAREAGLDGVVAVREGGRRENLLFVATAASLSRALRIGGARDRSVRSLLDQLALAQCPIDAAHVADIDTWDHHAAWERRLRSVSDSSSETVASTHLNEEPS